MGRIESIKNTEQYNGEARYYYSFLELALRVPKTIVLSMGGAMVCKTISTGCQGEANTLEALPVVCVLVVVLVEG